MNKKIQPWIILLPVLAGSIFSLVKFSCETFDIPRESDYISAVEMLKEHPYDSQKDAVAILPPWSLRPEQYIDKRPIISGDAIGSRPLHRYRYLYVIAEPDSSRYIKELIKNIGSPDIIKKTGRVILYRFHIKLPEVIYDFKRSLAKTKIMLERSHDNQIVVLKEFSDPISSEKNFVTRRWLYISSNGDEAVLAPPPGRGQSLKIVYPNVKMGDYLIIKTALTQMSANRTKDNVLFHIHAGDEKIASIVHRPEFGIKKAEINVKMFKNEMKDITFEIESSNNRRQQFAYDGFII